MEINYYAGLYPAVLIGVVAFVALVSIARAKGAWENLISAGILAFPVAASIFSLSYVFLNLRDQPLLIADFYTTEFKAGILNLRFVLITLSVRTLYVMYYELSNKIPEEIDTLRALVDGGSQPQTGRPLFAIPVQTAFYLIVGFANWIFIVQHRANFETQAIAWLLLYIIDDWNIILDYYWGLSGRILRGHRRRMMYSNLALAILIVEGAWRLESPLIAVVLAGVLGWLLYLLSVGDATLRFVVATSSGSLHGVPPAANPEA